MEVAISMFLHHHCLSFRLNRHRMAARLKEKLRPALTMPKGRKDAERGKKSLSAVAEMVEVQQSFDFGLLAAAAIKVKTLK